MNLDRVLNAMKSPKGCRVTITVDEPGFSDARALVKFPYEGMPNIIINPGVKYSFILKPHIAHQVVLEGMLRDGDPEDPDMEGGAYED
jgi:hypothetical protein